MAVERQIQGVIAEQNIIIDIPEFFGSDIIFALIMELNHSHKETVLCSKMPLIHNKGLLHPSNYFSLKWLHASRTLL